MSVAVVLAFAGALAAAVGTAMLMGRLIRAPRTDLAAWSVVLLALAVALGAQAMGFATKFSGPTFRAVAVTGLLLAPLWTAWGLVELAGRSMQARFATRLLTAALTVVPGVILVLDPLNSGGSAGRAWPGAARYMTLPRTLLTVVHVVAVGIALLMMTLAAVRTRRDAAWWEVFVPVAAAGAAVLLTVSLGLALPNIGYPLLAAAAAGSVWFAAIRSGEVRLDELRAGHFDERQDFDERYGVPAEPRHGRRRRGGQEDAEPALMLEDPAADRQVVSQGIDGREGGAPFARRGDVPAAPVPVPAELFGLIAIYTLADGGGADFDRLAERTVEAVRRNEPDTLLFVVHTVPKAPMQRIFYEVYRDRMAYAEHRRQPLVEEFFAKYRPHVLATNVIELQLQHAKMSTLPSLAAMFTPDRAGDL